MASQTLATICDGTHANSFCNIKIMSGETVLLTVIVNYSYMSGNFELDVKCRAQSRDFELIYTIVYNNVSIY